MKFKIFFFFVLITITTESFGAAFLPDFLSDIEAAKKRRHESEEIFMLSLKRNPLSNRELNGKNLNLPEIGYYGPDYPMKKKLAIIECNPERVVTCAPERLKASLGGPATEFYIIVTSFTRIHKNLGKKAKTSESPPGRVANYVLHSLLRRHDIEGKMFFNVKPHVGIFNQTNMAFSDGLPVDRIDNNLEVNAHPPEEYSPNNMKLSFTNQASTFWGLIKHKGHTIVTYNLVLNTKELEKSFKENVLAKARTLREFCLYFEKMFILNCHSSIRDLLVKSFLTILCCLDAGIESDILREIEIAKKEEAAKLEAERIRNEILARAKLDRFRETLEHLNEEYESLCEAFENAKNPKPKAPVLRRWPLAGTS
ncbi:hypothetical protein HN446_00045 [bacterium]|nr:hypothetical protein [bacterium]